MVSQLSKQLRRFSVPGLGVMDRYLAVEMLMPFLFGVAAFTSIGMAIGSLFELVRLITDSGLSITTALQVFLLRLPSIVVYTFPMSTLLAALLAYGRLSGDSEITALQACGVSIYRTVVPALVVSLAAALTTFWFNESVVPTANQEANATLYQSLDREKPDFKKDNILYPEYGFIERGDGKKDFALVRLFYARQFVDGEMNGLTILDFSQTGLNQIVTARSASWDSALGLWTFRDGTTYLVAPDGSYRNILRFEKQRVRISKRPLQFAQEVRRPEEMTTGELSRYITLVEQSGQDIRGLLVSLNQKYAVPVACCAFALIGAPLGLRRQRTSNSLALGLSILIIFGYYVFFFVTQAMGQTGALTPWLAAWLPVLATTAVGGILLWRAGR